MTTAHQNGRASNNNTSNVSGSHDNSSEDISNGDNDNNEDKDRRTLRVMLLSLKTSDTCLDFLHAQTTNDSLLSQAL